VADPDRPNRPDADIPTSDVLVAGAGPVGLALALALADTGVSVRVVDRGDPWPDPDAGDADADGRAWALASSSWQMLVNLGIAPALEDRSCASPGSRSATS